jgi:hypothetical protein
VIVVAGITYPLACAGGHDFEPRIKTQTRLTATVQIEIAIARIMKVVSCGVEQLSAVTCVAGNNEMA